MPNLYFSNLLNWMYPVMERLQTAFDKCTSLSLGVKQSTSQLRSFYGAEHPAALEHVKKAFQKFDQIYSLANLNFAASEKNDTASFQGN